MMKTTKKTLFIAIIASILSAYDAQAAQNQNKEQKMPVAYVKTVTVAISTSEPKVEAIGSVIANPGIIVRAEAAGRITKIFFKPGENVQEGAPLIEIYPDIIKAELAQFAADLKLKQLSFERITTLYKEHVVSKDDYDRAQTGLDAAKAIVEQYQAKLRQAAPLAPFTGKVGINLVNVGDYVNVGRDIVSLQALDPIYIDFSVPEVYVNQIKAGQEISATSESCPQTIFKGEVFAIDPLIDAKTRSVKVRAKVANHEEKLSPGTFAEVMLLLGEKTSAIKIPQIAVGYTATETYVYKVIAGYAKRTPVVLGERDEQNVAIKSGLSVGDIVITDGQLKITADGVPVIINE